LSFSRGGHSIKTTASFGAVDLQGRELQDFKELLRKADQMLYEAKRKGRNRIETPFLSEGVPASLAT
jgi:PleD family two-component response regulator